MIFFEILLSATIIFSAIYGLFLGGCMKNPGHSHNMLSYYTNLSNLAILVYQMLVLVSFAFPKSGFYSAVRNPVLQYSAANAITMTFLVYHFILFPAIKRKREAMTDAEKNGGVITPNNLCVHYIVPLLSFLFWLLFGNKNLSFSAVFEWLLVPAAYCIYILARAAHGINIYGKDTPYPYFFIDRRLLGTKIFLRNISLSLLAFFILGLITYGISRLYFL